MSAATSTWILAWSAIRDELRRRCRRGMQWPKQARLLRVMPFSHSYGQTVQHYYNQRRGVNLPFSPQDWLVLAEWAEAGISRIAIKEGVANMFERRDRELAFRHQQINSLAYCEQAVLQAEERLREASVGCHENFWGDNERQRHYTLLLALPPCRPMFQALQSERQVKAVAELFSVGLVFTVAPDEYRKHQVRERFGVELNFLDPEPANPFSLSGSSWLAGRSPRSGGARPRQSFLNREVNG